MLKSELIEKIFDKVENVSCGVVRTYGVSMGVGYDLLVMINYKEGQEQRIEAHALRQSWACPGYLRPNGPQYKYSGSCDIYKENVENYWQNGNGFKEYLSRFKKDQLVKWYNHLYL